MKKARRKPRFFIVAAGQLRSALAFLEDEDGPAAIVVELPEPDEPMEPEELLLGVLEAVEPEPVVPEEAAVEAEPLPVVEPCAAAPVLPPVGVPVVPIGVFCVLRWPAPTAGSDAEDFGGVPCANARPKEAAAMAAMTSLWDMIWTP
jgi:hypothetical protein